MKSPKIRELKEAIEAFFKGPYTHPFPKKPTPVPDNIRGRPKYYEDECIGCGACYEICPSNAIDMEDVIRDGKGIRILTQHYDKCIFCGQCEYHCTTKEGIKLSTEYELSGFDRKEMIEQCEKEMAKCELCGKYFAAKAHLKWLYERLGARTFTSMGLILTDTEELGLIDETAQRDDRKTTRMDNMRILCPDCKREVLLTEEWGTY